MVEPIKPKFLEELPDEIILIVNSLIEKQSINVLKSTISITIDEIIDELEKQNCKIKWQGGFLDLIKKNYSKYWFVSFNSSDDDYWLHFDPK
jgi:hypothetical protein